MVFSADFLHFLKIKNFFWSKSPKLSCSFNKCKPNNLLQNVSMCVALHDKRQAVTEKTPPNPLMAFPPFFLDSVVGLPDHTCTFRG